MGKEEIARNQQFLLFPPCFLLNQIIVYPFVHIFDIISLFAAEFEEPKIGILGKELRSNFHYLSHINVKIYIQVCNLTLYHSILRLTTLRQNPLENNVGKGAAFSLFPAMVFSQSKTTLII